MQGWRFVGDQRRRDDEYTQGNQACLDNLIAIHGMRLAHCEDLAAAARETRPPNLLLPLFRVLDSAQLKKFQVTDGGPGFLHGSI